MNKQNSRIRQTLIATMINIRVHAGHPQFSGRTIREDEISEFAIEQIKHGFNDPEKHEVTLQHVYQSIVGGF